MTTQDKLADALRVLIEHCTVSDDSCYGTLSTSFVRKIAEEALAEHDAPDKCFCDRMYPDSNPNASCGDCPTRDYDAQPAPAPVQPSSVSTPIPNTGTYFAQPPANGDAHSVVDALPPLPPVDGYDKRVAGHYSAASMHAYARTAIAALQQKVTTPALPELTDEDVAAAWDVLLITGQPIDSCACDGDMRKVLESYRARLMAKAGGDRG